MANNSYTAASIEVLSGLEPVQRRPGMYTDTSRPNHLAQEVIDNSVDEAMAGFAQRIDVVLYKDGSLSVADDGRGMPVDIHPEHQLSGVELILTRLHSGGKFSNKNYKYSGGLHGVGVSVVNALSKRLDVRIRRGGHEYTISYAYGEKKSPLTSVGSIAKHISGTMVHFWPEERYFDSPKILAPRLQQLLRAKAVLCPGLTITFFDENTAEREEWHFENGLKDYLAQSLTHVAHVPPEPFVGHFVGEVHEIAWAVAWLAEDHEALAESYVNLIPTIQGGTHVNGLRTGLLDALREFCEHRQLLPRGLKLTGEDIWHNCSYILSVKIQEPQFSGQTKERLTSRDCAHWVTGAIKDHFILWLNQHIEFGQAIAEIVLAHAQQRLRSSKQVVRKKIASGPALPGKLADCTSQDVSRTELFLVEGDSAGGSTKQARDRTFQAVMPLRGKILNTWEVDSAQVLASQEIHDISVAIGLDPHSEDLRQLRYGKICILTDADYDGLHIATLLCALFVKHFKSLVRHGHVFVAMPPLYRIDIGKAVYYALNDSEKESILARLASEHSKNKISIQRFKGLGEMNPLQLRETTMHPDTRRLVQLTLDDTLNDPLLDMLLAKKRSGDRKMWLEQKGHLVDFSTL